MKQTITEWKKEILHSTEKKAMPIMTYPGLSLVGSSVYEMVTRGEVQYNCIRALAERYPSIACATLIMDLSVEAELFGSKVCYSENEIPTVTSRLIDSFEKIDKLKIPVAGEGRSGQNLLAAKLAVENITDRPVFGGIIGPYSLAGRLYDITEMMMGILLEPEGAHSLLKVCTDFLKQYAKAFKDEGCHGVVIAEPAAGLLASEQCEEFSSIYIKEIVEYVQDEDFIVILHNCGNTVGLVPTMLGTGAEGFHVGNAVDMMQILVQMPADKLTFGNIDPAGIIKNGTPTQVKARCLELLEQTAGYSNFVLSSGCDIPPGTPLENMDAFFAAVREYNSSLKFKVAPGVLSGN
jgi:uroporphyrinogen decarboxylase